MVTKTTAEEIPAMKENFAELFNEMFGEDKGLEGSVVKGTIVALSDDNVTVDVGLKSEGRIARREFGFNAEMKVGEAVIQFPACFKEVFLFVLILHDEIIDVDGIFPEFPFVFRFCKRVVIGNLVNPDTEVDVFHLCVVDSYVAQTIVEGNGNPAVFLAVKFVPEVDEMIQVKLSWYIWHKGRFLSEKV